jgi:AcrR family transcriptional regulator
MTTPAVARPVHRAGRPRDAAIDAAILDATLELLAERGYQALSIAAVAERAGVGKPAVYRRHPSKERLVVAALDRLADGPEPELPDDTRGALTLLLAATARAVGTPGGLTIMGSLLAQGSRDPELLRAFQVAVFEPRHAMVDAILRRGIERGEIAQDADLEVADALLFGAVLARATLGHQLDADWVERVVAVAWRTVAADAR